MANVVIFSINQIGDILYFSHNIKKRATSTGTSVTDPTDIALTERQKCFFKWKLTQTDPNPTYQTAIPNIFKQTNLPNPIQSTHTVTKNKINIYNEWNNSNN